MQFKTKKIAQLSERFQRYIILKQILYFIFVFFLFSEERKTMYLTLINLACVKKFVGTDEVTFSLKWSCDEYTVYIWPCSKEIK